MSNERKYEIAKEYVDKQLNVMKEFNAEPKNLSASDYRSLVERVAQTIRTETKTKA
jgi:hypothetical protein